jgi:precorrin-6Y C5,15-methyltransferase (decarboxylating)
VKDVYIIGMGLSAADLTEAHLRIIRSAQLLIGGRRHLEAFERLKAQRHVISGKVAEVIDLIKHHRPYLRIVVLASGDPLFYGIGTRIIKELGREGITVLPNITSIAAAFARIGKSWENTRCISLHGRDQRFELLHALAAGGPVGVLTDAHQSPQWIAHWLLEKGIRNVKCAVFEQLGSDREAFAWYSLEQAAKKNFAHPNIMILDGAGDDANHPTLSLGMDTDAFTHDQGLITKPEVRAVSLAKLCLRPGLILWDLGAGSGSVGIEASILIGSGRVVAIEHDPHRVRQIRQNAAKYGVWNHKVIEADLTNGLDRLPPPDRIFIGGGGRHLDTITRTATNYLDEGGVVVINTVLVDNLARILDLLEDKGFETEVVQIQVSRGKDMPWSRRMQAENPVWIISAVRPPDAG